MNSPPATLLINAHSRQGQARFEEAVTACKDAGIVLGKTVALQSTEECKKCLGQVIENGAKLVIIGGGDGTLSSCAAQLAGTSTVLGVLPMGTGNTFARSLSLPFNLNDAAQVIADGRVADIDLGVVNGRIFLNSVTLGFSVKIAQILDSKLKAKWGLLAWPIYGWKIFWQHRALHLKLTSNDMTYKLATHQLVIANGRFVAGPVAATPDATIANHCLEIFALGRKSRASLFFAGLDWLRGYHFHSPETAFDGTKPLTVTSLRGPVMASVDGEMSEHTPLKIEIRPAALRAIVPQEFEAGQCATSP